VREIVEECTAIVDNGTKPDEMIIDAKILLGSGNIVFHVVQKVDANLRQF